MTRHIDGELQTLKRTILEMGGLVEKAIEGACSGLFHRDDQMLVKVHEIENSINKLHLDVDQKCLTLLARQAPVAKDLRVVLAAVKINSDLERMGDQAVNVAHIAKDLMVHSAVPHLKELEQMVEEVRVMVKDSLDAFSRRDVQCCHAILKRDDVVDGFKKRIVDHLKESLISAKASNADVCLHLINVARNLERVADHATNIAEDVIFLMTGDDIRHGHHQEGTGS